MTERYELARYIVASKPHTAESVTSESSWHGRLGHD